MINTSQRLNRKVAGSDPLIAGQLFSTWQPCVDNDPLPKYDARYRFINKKEVKRIKNIAVIFCEVRRYGDFRFPHQIIESRQCANQWF